MRTLQDLRASIPELEGLDDETAINVIQQVYYPTTGVDQIAARLGYKPPPPVVEPRGAIRGLGDLGAELGSGIARGVKFTADAFGADNAVSSGADAVDKFARNLLSAQAKQEDQEVSRLMAEAQDAGIWEQVKAAAKAFTIAPVRMGVNALGTSAPTIAAGVAGAAARVGAAGMAGAMAGMGGVQGAGVVKGSIFEAVKAEQMKMPGMTEAEAEVIASRAQEYGGENTGNIVGGIGIGALAGSTGVQPVIARALTGGARQTAGTAVERGLMARAALGVAKEAPIEGLQGGQEQYATNVALQRQGFDVPTFRGVAGNAALEMLASAPIGAVAGALERTEATRAIADAETVDDAVAAFNAATIPVGEATELFDTAARPRTANLDAMAEIRGLEPEQQQQALGLLATIQNPRASDSVRRFAQNQFDALLLPVRQIPVGEATEILPTGEATELTDEARAQFAERRSFTDQRRIDTGIPTGEATEIDQPGLEVSEFDAIPVGEATELATREPAGEFPPREPRTGGLVDGQEVDPAGPNAVRAYIDQLRTVNTMQARAFVREFDAGRITSAEIMARIVPPGPQTAQQRIEAAASQAPADPAGLQMPQQRANDARRPPDPPDDVAGAGSAGMPDAPRPGGPGGVAPDGQGNATGPTASAAGSDGPSPAQADAEQDALGFTDLTTGDGMPYGSKSAAAVRARKEGGEVVDVEGGWVVRVQPAGPAVVPAAASGAVEVGGVDQDGRSLESEIKAAYQVANGMFGKDIISGGIQNDWQRLLDAISARDTKAMDALEQRYSKDEARDGMGSGTSGAGPGKVKQSRRGAAQLARFARVIRQKMEADQQTLPSQSPPPAQAAAATDEPPAPVIQNRNRRSAASIQQMQGIAARPDYGRLGFSRDFATGAPVIVADDIQTDRLGKKDRTTASDGRKINVQYAAVEADEVLASNTSDGLAVPAWDATTGPKAIAGNGRIAGLKAAYTAGNAGGYRAELEEDSLHGINPDVLAGMKSPIIVRVMSRDDITDDIGDVSNVAGQLTLSPVEQARTDVARVKLDSLEFRADGDPTPEAVRRFVQAMPESEQGGLIDSVTGSPNRKAIDRMQAAVFAAAYDSDGLINLMAEAADPEARLVLSALQQAAPKMARLAGLGSLDIRDAVIQAAEAAVNARRQGKPLRFAAQQVDLTAGKDMLAVLQVFADNARSVAPVVAALNRAADFAYNEGTKAATDMFGEVQRADRDAVINRLKGDDEAGSQESLVQPTGRQPDGSDVARPLADGGREGDAQAPEDNRPADEAGSAQEGLKRDPDALPDGVRRRLEIATASLGELRRELEGGLQAFPRGGASMDGMVRDRLPAITKSREALAEFRKHAERNGFDAEAIIEALGGDVDLAEFVARAAPPAEPEPEPVAPEPEPAVEPDPEPEAAPEAPPPEPTDIERVIALQATSGRGRITDDEVDLLNSVVDEQGAEAIAGLERGATFAEAGITFSEDGDQRVILRDGVRVGTFVGQRTREAVLSVLRGNQPGAAPRPVDSRNAPTTAAQGRAESRSQAENAISELRKRKSVLTSLLECMR